MSGLSALSSAETTFSGYSVVWPTRKSGGLETGSSNLPILTNFDDIYNRMIKLKQILTEYSGEDNGLPEHLSAMYSLYHRATPVKKVRLAKMMIGWHGKHLSPAHVYHIILGLDKRFVLSVFEFAKSRLSPEQLVDTEKQIMLFHQPPQQFSQAAQ